MAKNDPKRAGFNPAVGVLILGAILILVAIVVLLAQRQPQAAQVLPQPTQAADIPYPLVPRVNLADAKRAYDDGSAVFVDVRSAAAYSAAHVPGALSLPETELESRLTELNPQDWIITYCT